MTLQEPPTPVYMPQPLNLGVGGALSAVQGVSQPLIVVQQTPPADSWLKAHSGQLIAAGGAGAIVVAVLLAAAVVAIAVGVGAISCALGWLVIRSVIGPELKK
jgi:hypothetical protein